MLMMECALGNGSDCVGDWKNQDCSSGGFFFVFFLYVFFGDGGHA